MLLGIYIAGTAISCAISLAMEKAISKGWSLYKKNTLSPEDLERIVRIKNIFSILQERLENDPDHKHLIDNIKISMINRLDHSSSKELKEIELSISHILLNCS